ncbi:MAG: PepSY domain-containing protein [Ardenticatenaceae bacterium]|nr:PepSY domain-containing protein [Anaerolineales bacterium]MCB8941744.1 PepSY domain-containing protein [Ardenticatenaceae bacterium]MCB8972855.1 PepSY domain-containing protein [Ardenticatenaceae bacterium]
MKQTNWMSRRTIFALLATGILLGGVLIGVFMNAPRNASAQSGQLTPNEAKAVAEEASPGATATDVTLEREGSQDVYEVQLDNGMEVEIDAATGEILETELSDDGDDGNDGPDSANEVDDD